MSRKSVSVQRYINIVLIFYATLPPKGNLKSIFTNVKKKTGYWIWRLSYIFKLKIAHPKQHHSFWLYFVSTKGRKTHNFSNNYKNNRRIAQSRKVVLAFLFITTELEVNA